MAEEAENDGAISVVSFSCGGEGSVEIASQGVRFLFKEETNWAAARMGPTVWEEDGPMPMV